MITIIIPFYNEESKNKKSLNLFLKELLKYISLKFNNNNKFILIDDGSEDNTSNEIKQFLRSLNKKQKKMIKFFKNKKNEGYAYCLKRGFKLSKTKYVTTIPSDNDLPFIDYRKYTSKNIDFVMYPRSNMEKYSRCRLLLSTLFNLFYNLAFDVKVQYIQGSGLYKLSKIKKINIYANSGGAYLAELAVKLLRSKITYSEEPVYFKNKSIIDRTVSLVNFLKIFKNFVVAYLDVNFFNKKKYMYKAKKIYL